MHLARECSRPLSSRSSTVLSTPDKKVSVGFSRNRRAGRAEGDAGSSIADSHTLPPYQLRGDDRDSAVPCESAPTGRRRHSRLLVSLPVHSLIVAAVDPSLSLSHRFSAPSGLLSTAAPPCSRCRRHERRTIAAGSAGIVSEEGKQHYAIRVTQCRARLSLTC